MTEKSRIVLGMDRGWAVTSAQDDVEIDSFEWAKAVLQWATGYLREDRRMGRGKLGMAVDCLEFLT